MRVFHVLFETFLVLACMISGYCIAYTMNEFNAAREFYDEYKYQQEFGKLLDYKQIRSHRNLMKRFIESEMERKTQ